MTALKKLLALLLCLAMLLSFAACGGDDSADSEDDGEKEETQEPLNKGDENCAHEWGDWEVTKENTCTKDGVRMRQCQLCGREEKETVVAPGHAFYGGECETCGKNAPDCEHKKTELVVISQATCEEDGVTNEVCTKCHGIVDVDYDYAYGHDTEYHEGQDPACTEPGWYYYYSCVNCDYTTKEEIPAKGHSYIAGTCVDCGAVDDSFEVVDAPASVTNEHTVTKAEAVPYDAVAAQVDVHTGNMAQDGQQDTYTFTAAVTGRYYIWMTEIYDSAEMGIYVHNPLAEEIGRNSYAGNNEGVTVNCVAGETYTVYVCESWGTSTYQLNIGHMKALVDISGYDVVNDSIEFQEQLNAYTFVPAVDGTYRFQFSEMMDNCELRIRVYNRLNEEIASSSYCANGEGVTVNGMVAGETYTIQVEHDYNALSAYTMSIGKQSATVDVSAFTAVHDALSFTDQKNQYTFTVPANGTYRFELANVSQDCDMNLYVYNSLGEQVGSYTYADNGDGVTMSDLVAGDTYTIAICQRYTLTGYTLKICTPKAAQDISSDMAINDRIDFGDQVNVYNFVADKSGDHTVAIVNMDEDAHVEIYIYDAAGSTVDYDTYFYNGDTLWIYDVQEGDAYTIQIHADGYLTDYTVSVQ